MLSKNKIKYLRSLHSKKFRDEHAAFLVEGEKSVSELLVNKPEIILEVFHLENYSFVSNLNQKINSQVISENDLVQISTLKSPNKVIAVCKKWDSNIESAQFVLALDEIQDPGNLGTLIRLSDWFGIDAIICSPNTAEFYNPKVIQASMGSVFRTKIIYTDLKVYLEKTNLPIYGALLNGENIYAKKLSRKGVIILGNEGKGISSEIIKQIQIPITIPKIGETESLNVATAGAIILSEFSRAELS